MKLFPFLPGILLPITLLASGTTSLAETFTWTDDSGTLYFTDSAESVPKQQGRKVRVREDVTAVSVDPWEAAERERLQRLAAQAERVQQRLAAERRAQEERELQVRRQRERAEEQARQRAQAQAAAARAQNEWQSVDGKFGTIRISPPMKMGYGST